MIQEAEAIQVGGEEKPRNATRGSSELARPVTRIAGMLRAPSLQVECMTGTPAPKTTAFMKAMKPSAVLADVIGAESVPRTEVTKRLWDYIKAHNLQNPANKRNILCDAKLKAVMGKDEVTMFEMTGLVGKHLGPA